MLRGLLPLQRAVVAVAVAAAIAAATVVVTEGGGDCNSCYCCCLSTKRVDRHRLPELTFTHGRNFLSEFAGEIEMR